MFFPCCHCTAGASPWHRHTPPPPQQPNQVYMPRATASAPFAVDWRLVLHRAAFLIADEGAGGEWRQHPNVTPNVLSMFDMAGKNVLITGNVHVLASPIKLDLAHQPAPPPPPPRCLVPSSVHLLRARETHRIPFPCPLTHTHTRVDRTSLAKGAGCVLSERAHNNKPSIAPCRAGGHVINGSPCRAGAMLANALITTRFITYVLLFYACRWMWLAWHSFLPCSG